MCRGAAIVACVMTWLMVAMRPAAAQEPPTSPAPSDEPAPPGHEEGADPSLGAADDDPDRDAAEEGDAPSEDEPAEQVDDPTGDAPPPENGPSEQADDAPGDVPPDEPASPEGDADPEGEPPPEGALEATEAPTGVSGGAEGQAPAAETSTPEDDPARDPERARLHERLGRAYYSSSRFEEAAREFRRAHRLSGDASLLHDLFLANRDAGQLDAAADALERYLAEVPDAPDRARLTMRLHNLRRLQARRDNDESGAGPPGEEPAGAPPTDASAEPGTEPPTEERAAQDLTELDTEPQGRSVAPWLVMGLGSALLISGAVTGGLALKTQNDLRELCGEEGGCPADSGFQADVNRGRTMATATDVLLGLGVAAMGAGVALYFLLDDLAARAPTRPDGPTASVGCMPGGCMGTMRMRF